MKNEIDKIICLSYKFNWDYCFECDKVVPYKDHQCFYYGSTASIGDPYDDDISDLELEKYDNGQF